MSQDERRRIIRPQHERAINPLASPPLVSVALRAMKRLIALLSLLASPLVADYHVVRHIHIGGTGGWDYVTVDSGSRRLYVSHSDRVEVVDIDRGKVVGTIPKTEGVHGIAVAPELHRGFVSNGRTSTMTIFDLDKLTTITEVKTTGDNPDAILYDPYSKHVFTFNGRGKNATAFDSDGKVLATIALAGRPEFAVSDNNGRVFVNIEDTSEIAVIDATKLAVERRNSISPCEEPSGIAIDRSRHRLFSVCANGKMVISDANDGQVVAAVAIGKGPDAAAFDEASQRAFSSNGADGTVSIVHEVSSTEFNLERDVPTERGARTMALDPKTHHLFLLTAKFGPPPAPTAERPKPRPTILPDTFEIIELAP
jgi:DNA-binding beta-propeller fold protein YncE